MIFLQNRCTDRRDRKGVAPKTWKPSPGKIYRVVLENMQKIQPNFPPFGSKKIAELTGCIWTFKGKGKTTAISTADCTYSDEFMSAEAVRLRLFRQPTAPRAEQYMQVIGGKTTAISTADCTPLSHKVAKAQGKTTAISTADCTPRAFNQPQIMGKTTAISTADCTLMGWRPLRFCVRLRLFRQPTAPWSSTLRVALQVRLRLFRQPTAPVTRT